MKRGGFTLIELLVVIAIIALLMAILMPTLSKAKRMAKATMCAAQEKQWGSFFTMYTDDFKGSFMGGRSVDWPTQCWWWVLEPYYKNRELLCCPMANNPKKESKDGYGNYGTWGPTWYPTPSKGPNAGVPFYGSYGINAWICNPQFKTGEIPMYGDSAKYWRTTNIKGQSDIPMLGDSWWDQAWAEAFDSVPPYAGWWDIVGTGDDMAHFFVMRHDGFINMLYMDYTVRKVHLRELWPQKWNRFTDQEDSPTENDFPPWLRQL